MNGIISPVALAALDMALVAAKKGPAPRQSVNSRHADKFVLRGYAELFSELADIGIQQCRCVNSEIVAAIMEGIDGQARGNAMLRILVASVGPEVAARVLSEVPAFDLSGGGTPADFTVRFPPQLRESVSLAVLREVELGVEGAHRTMRSWILSALVAWVRLQRQQYALLSAAIELERFGQGAGDQPQWGGARVSCG